MLTNLQLVEFVKKVFFAAWVYWYGTYGNKCTQSKYESKAKQYPSHYTSSRKAGYMQDIANGSTCSDCVGLLKAFFWCLGTFGATPKYGTNGCPDTSANGMFKLCKETGKISTIPDIPGLVVWKDGHIGVYIGGGETIEMNSFAKDCIWRKVTEGTWTHWGKLPPSMLEYVAGSENSVVELHIGDRALGKGCIGADVVELQEALMALGYQLPIYGADGDFGTETAAAVMSLQGHCGLDETGVFDTATYKALLDAQKPPVVIPEQDLPGEDANTEYPQRRFVLILDGTEDLLRELQAKHGGMLAEVDSVSVT